jgi:hypothetical protein
MIAAFVSKYAQRLQQRIKNYTDTLASPIFKDYQMEYICLSLAIGLDKTKNVGRTTLRFLKHQAISLLDGRR